MRTIKYKTWYDNEEPNMMSISKDVMRKISEI